MTETTSASLVHHYFVDEAGDLTLFDKRGRVLVGQPGVSSFFMVGAAFLPDPALAETALNALRAQLLADPYFKGVPSMQAEANKTAIAFHAKDDLPEVRREVFKLLPAFGAKVIVALRRKDVLAREAQALFRYGRKLQANDVYDDLVKRLFRNLLHKADENQIVFAWRGKSRREAALHQAIANAKQDFSARRKRAPDVPTVIHSAYPSEHAGLQVIDYYLWALQRIYEMQEERFFAAVADGYQLILDMDYPQRQPAGAWYNRHHRLTLEKIKDPQTD